MSIRILFHKRDDTGSGSFNACFRGDTAVGIADEGEVGVGRSKRSVNFPPFGTHHDQINGEIPQKQYYYQRKRRMYAPSLDSQIEVRFKWELHTIVNVRSEEEWDS